MGVDILNPVQCSAAGMDPVMLKEKYGDKLVFWGGGVDTQHVLPFGTPEQVREQVRERLEIFSKGGGYVFNTIHNILGKPRWRILWHCLKNFVDLTHTFSINKGLIAAMAEVGRLFEEGEQLPSYILHYFYLNLEIFIDQIPA